MKTLKTFFPKFQGEVKQAQVSGNLDAPEGGFDAIMQAITCHDQVRKKNVQSHDLFCPLKAISKRKTRDFFWFRW